MKLEDREIMREDADANGVPAAVIGWRKTADPKVAARVIAADEGSQDGRSQWVWIRLANGDLVLATYPQGDTYFDTEADHGRP